MIHRTTQRKMADEMLNDPDELIVESKSKHAALYSTPNGDAVLMSGDLSGPQEEMDVKVQRFARQMRSTVGTTWRN